MSESKMNNMAEVNSADRVSAEIEKVLVNGDLSGLTEKQRIEYYGAVCRSVGLNPLTKPFEYIKLNNKLTLYALRAATDQLRSLHKVSINVTARELIEGVYVVTAKAKNADGREDESTGAVHVLGLKGEPLANAYMKAETKAKRRVTLSICGLGLLDETEVETIPGAVKGPELSFTKEKERDVSPEEPKKELKNHADPKISFGKFKGKKISEIPKNKLADYVIEVSDALKSSGKPEPKWFTEIRKVSGL